MLSERLVDAVSAVAQYQAELAVYSKKFEVVTERLMQLELSQKCCCLSAASASPRNKKGIRKQPVRSKGKLDKSDKEAVGGNLHEETDAGKSAGNGSGRSENAATDGDESVADVWQEVRNRKIRLSSVRCTAGPEVTSLKAVEIRKYVHLWNMMSGVDDIRAYMQTLCPGKGFTVEELKARGDYKSYKIGVPCELYEKCLSPEVWPENARVKAWLFRRPQDSGAASAWSKRQHNASSLGRAWWVAAPGPFHNFPALPPRAAGTRCALGQLTPQGLLQMLTLGNILKEAYGEKLGADRQAFESVVGVQERPDAEVVRDAVSLTCATTRRYPVSRNRKNQNSPSKNTKNSKQIPYLEETY
ncbi:hypothetical protein MSG28_013056 [Choristoneura fumiferana]|uniref:Uncharacterized protein n=1 Tax=Choristoneura fumiferana TaxID=7141 RepID=A0ACC0KSC8_CHOFU|nr:hypothetical protein MSG28_013056 [Choristoneura fumiferana]